MSSQARKRLVIATTNRAKLRELFVLLSDVKQELVLLSDLGIEADIEESGKTFNDNAVLKAQGYGAISGLPTLADDSGLEVDALRGEPGIYSARFAGKDATDDDRIALLLAKLRDIPEKQRTARFRCVIAIAWSSKDVEIHEGECLGRITFEPRGVNGFGYDPVFYIPHLSKTMGELTEREKNLVSHRSRALAGVVSSLKKRQ